VKPYAEKIMIVEEEQVTPMHFHWAKMEDIINRGGGCLVVQVYNSTSEETLSDTPVKVALDGVEKTVPAGTKLRLAPGESITVPRGLFHSFWGEKGSGTVLVGEVSQVNDDNTDNRFLVAAGRFQQIEEDVPATFLLCNEYPPCRP
jgi:D-lyxose ketol-isomerase